MKMQDFRILRRYMADGDKYWRLWMRCNRHDLLEIAYKSADFKFYALGLALAEMRKALMDEFEAILRWLRVIK